MTQDGKQMQVSYRDTLKLDNYHILAYDRAENTFRIISDVGSAISTKTAIQIVAQRLLEYKDKVSFLTAFLEAAQTENGETK